MEGKHYLRGMDWVAAGLSASCAGTPGGGNDFLLSLDFDSPVVPEELREVLSVLPEPVLRLLNGRTGRCWNLAPCWRPGDVRLPELLVVPAGSDPDYETRRFADTPMRSQLALLLVPGEATSRLVVKFGHRLFDGGGAELVLRDLFAGRVEAPSPRSSGLERWRARMAVGRRVNRALIALSRTPCCRTEFSGAAGAGALFAERRLPLAMVQRLAMEHCGPFMAGTMVAALVARAFDWWRRKHYPGNEAVLMPMSVDRRIADRGGTFFNHWSCLPLLWQPGETVPPRQWWIDAARKEIAAAMESGLPDDFAEVNDLMRILPERMMGKLALSGFGGGAGSLMFSFLSRSSLPERWGKHRIVGARHWPLMPPRPGVGIFCNAFGETLNVVLSCREGWSDGAGREELLRRIENELLWRD